uniref:Putative secreted protein n=1 Tax=Ixodes ricinus TaxID=34613 RepID=A0A6B0ULG2_IXORI
MLLFTLFSLMELFSRPTNLKVVEDIATDTQRRQHNTLSYGALFYVLAEVSPPGRARRLSSHFNCARSGGSEALSKTGSPCWRWSFHCTSYDATDIRLPITQTKISPPPAGPRNRK